MKIKHLWRFTLLMGMVSSISIFGGCSQVASGSSGYEGGEYDEEDVIEFSYKDPKWTFAEWEEVKYYRAELFDSVQTELSADGWEEVHFQGLDFVNVNALNPRVDSGQFYLEYDPEKEIENFMLSFEKEEDDAPLLGLLTFSSAPDGFEVTHLVEPIEVDDRLYYPIEKEYMTSKIGSVHAGFYNKDGSAYTSPVKKVMFADNTLESYPLELTANLIVAGNYRGTADDLTPEELGEKILERLKKGLNPGGITVKGLNVLYAKDHPEVGHHFTDDWDVVMTRNGYNHVFDSLARWPGHEGEICFVLSYWIDEFDEDKSGADYVAGYSPIAGTIYYDGSEAYANYVTIATHIKKGVQTENLQSVIIANVAVHELGHFMGLEHTTEYGGTVFDQLDDTPECEKMQNSDYDINDCPDSHYLMFPRAQWDWEYSTFTPQQMDVMRMYLSTTPHK